MDIVRRWHSLFNCIRNVSTLIHIITYYILLANMACTLLRSVCAYVCMYIRPQYTCIQSTTKAFITIFLHIFYYTLNIILDTSTWVYIAVISSIIVLCWMCQQYNVLTIILFLIITLASCTFQQTTTFQQPTDTAVFSTKQSCCLVE